MPLLGQGNRRLWRNTTAPQAKNFGVSSRRYDLQLETTYARAAVISGCRRPRWRRALLDAALLPRALLRFSLFVPISASRFRRASLEQVGRSPARSRNARISNNAPQELLVFTEGRPFFSPCPFPAPQALKNMAQPTRAEVLRVLYWKPALLFGCREAPAAPQGQCRRHPLRAAGGKFFEVGPEWVDLGVREGVRAKI